MKNQFISASIFLSSFLFSSCVEGANENSYGKPLLEIKAGYFFFAEEKMRKIYDQGGLDLQLSTSYPVWKWFQIYGSLEYLHKHGHSLSDHQKTNIWQIPVTLGIKSAIKVYRSLSYYLTLGPRYFFVHVHNDSSFVDRNLGKSGAGLFVGTGFTFTPYHHLILDVFGEYSYEKVHFHSSKTGVYTKGRQVGGFAFGGGVGYVF